jgi:hypothetical protein
VNSTINLRAGQFTAQLKNQIGLRRLRRLQFVREQFFLAAAAQNIKMEFFNTPPAIDGMRRSIPDHGWR